MELAYYLKRPNSPKKSIIYARIHYDGMEAKYYIPESGIHPTKWNPTKKEVRQSYTGYAGFNHRLKKSKEEIFEIINRYKSENMQAAPHPSILKKLLDDHFRKKTEVKVSFQQYFKGMIERSESGERTVNRGKRKGKPITPGTIKTYWGTYNIIQAYEGSRSKTLYFDDITMAFYNDFKSYMIKDKKLTVNYMGRHINKIITVMSEAWDNGIHRNDIFKTKAFATMSEDVDAIYLTTADILEFQGLDLSNNPRLDRTRDWLIIGCNTGLRHGDLMTLTPAMINRDRMIEIKPSKTADPIYIPVKPVIFDIIKKYGGNFPPPVSDQKMNDSLKDLGKETECMKAIYGNSRTKGGETVHKKGPKYNFLTTHTMRRSFASNEYYAGDIPIQLIMAITGHSTEDHFYKYIKVKPSDKAKQTSAIWEGRENKPTNIPNN